MGVHDSLTEPNAGRAVGRVRGYTMEFNADSHPQFMDVSTEAGVSQSASIPGETPILTSFDYELVTHSQSRIASVLHFVLKRLLDVFGASILLLILMPLFVFVAIAIKLDSTGPIFFVQERVGAKRTRSSGEVAWRMRTFPMLKFRSMADGSDPRLHQEYIKEFIRGRPALVENGRNHFKIANDPRVTRIGALIRKTSIDELPQLINVLKGEMSLVGPRPVPLYEAENYLPWHNERLASLPGITGYWQVFGRGRVDFDEMIRMDVHYVRQQSMWLDIKLMILTIPAVVRGVGAK